MSNQVIPAEAVEAAAQALRDAFDWGVDGFEEQAKRALEAAAPHMLAGHLLKLAADVKARGDIGKDEGLEAWDYLTWKAKQLRTAK